MNYHHPVIQTCFFCHKPVFRIYLDLNFSVRSGNKSKRMHANNKKEYQCLGEDKAIVRAAAAADIDSTNNYAIRHLYRRQCYLQTTVYDSLNTLNQF